MYENTDTRPFATVRNHVHIINLVRYEKCLAVVEWSGKKKTGLMKKRHLTEMKMNNSSLR